MWASAVVVAVAVGHRGTAKESACCSMESTLLSGSCRYGGRGTVEREQKKRTRNQSGRAKQRFSLRCGCFASSIMLSFIHNSVTSNEATPLDKMLIFHHDTPHVFPDSSAAVFIDTARPSTFVSALSCHERHDEGIDTSFWSWAYHRYGTLLAVLTGVGVQRFQLNNAQGDT